MKNLFRKAFCAFLICLCIFSLVSCGSGISDDEAKSHANDFFAAVGAGDFKKAEGFLHPERPAELETFFQGIEETMNIDFQAGITIEKYTGFSSTVYDSTVDGATYELIIQTKVGDTAVKFTVEIVRNDNGFGIYNLGLDG